MPSFSLRGYDHVKVVLKDLNSFEAFLKVFGFRKLEDTSPSLQKPKSIWGSGEAVFCLYDSSHSLAKHHFEMHGDTIFDLSFVVESSIAFPPFIEGVGGMKHTLVAKRTFPIQPAPLGVLRFDHNTLNIERGKLDESVNFYLEAFGFEKGQYFKIKGKETGLYSWVTRAPDKSVQIPFNEAADPKSQIQEYIDIHRGPGVQHLAFRVENIIETMRKVRSHPETHFKFLDIPDTYYELVSKRFKIRESFSDLEKLRILVDQDPQGGYLLQIFTEVLFGGFFVELIQREGNDGFGEGNFTALFESMELDQKRRGLI